jgi:formate hydrogenlyase subunit 4
MHHTNITKLLCTLCLVIFVFLWSIALNFSNKLVQLPLDLISWLVVAYVVLFDGWLPSN